VPADLDSRRGNVIPDVEFVTHLLGREFRKESGVFVLQADAARLIAWHFNYPGLTERAGIG
jgi:hypothetical protein